MRALAAIALAVGAVATAGVAGGPSGTIVYSSAGDGEDWEIYAFPAAGGSAANISRDRDSDVRPLLSPDGARVAFARGVARLDGESVVVANADGSEQKVLPFVEPRALGWASDSRRLLVRHRLGRETRYRITAVDVVTGIRTEIGPGSAAGWSPDGRLVALVDPTRDGLGTLYVAEPGSTPRRVGTDPTTSFAWSPDGNRLASAGSALRVHDLAAGSSIEIARIRAADIAWSPDGSRVYAFADRNLVSVAASGGDVRTLVHTIARFVVSPVGERIAVVQGIGEGEEVVVWDTDGIKKLGRATSPAWSPSGRELAFVRTQPRLVLAVLDVGSGATRTLDEPRLTRGGFLGDVTWRPDGSAVVAARYIHPGQQDLFTVQADGTDRRRLFHTGGLASESHPRWSPDGSLLAFERWTCVGDPNIGCTPHLDIHVFDFATGRVRLVARNAGAPAWSPDGSQLAFAISDAGIGVVRADGRGRRVLTRFGDELPAWSPGGREIAFVRTGRSGEVSNAILLMDVRTRSSRVLVDLSETQTTAAHLQWSPDGSRLGFTQGDDVPPWEDSLGPEQVVVVNRRGRVVSRRAVPDEYGSGFAWSPDGSYMAHGGQDLVITRADGRRVRTLLTQDALEPAWQPRCDRIGSDGHDELNGSARSELLCGRGGDDRILGGRGKDHLFGGDGNDAIYARDGAFDVVGCGSGSDTAHVDPIDYVGVDCERVDRR